jgi:purine-binding chemotaxis protein CheW
MSLTTEIKTSKSASEVEFVTFYVGDLLIGVDINQLDEINRLVDITPVPHAPSYVRGVVNLRGEVVTVIDLRKILGLEESKNTGQNRNVIVNSQGEQIGLLVDRIADVVRASPEDLDEPPANISGMDGRFFKNICQLDNNLLIVLDVDAAIDVKEAGQSVFSS